jgi:hypothetical protein
VGVCNRASELCVRPGLHSNTTLKSVWEDIMAGGYEGTRHKIQLRVLSSSDCGELVGPCTFGFVDGLVRAQVMHAFITFLHDEVAWHE